MEKHSQECPTCKTTFITYEHKFCSRNCYWEDMRGIKGEKSNNYRLVVGKSQVHKWLNVHYGKPKICESKNCTGKSATYDWALKTGHTYNRDRNDFFRFCRSCHRFYDMTPEKRALAVKQLDNWRDKQKQQLTNKNK